MAASGKTYREISDALRESGLDVSYASVARLVQETTDERREVAREVAAREARATIPLVTGVLRRWVERCDTLIEQQNDGDSAAVARLITAGTKAAKTLHEITVGDKTGEDQVSILRDEALAILAAKRKRDKAEPDEGEPEA